MQVLRFHDTTGQEIVVREPADGTMAIRYGSQLIVEQGQEAIFLRDGQAFDRFGPGRHTLRTKNLPLLAPILSLPFGGDSPFQAAVIFIAHKTFIDLRWGTKEPVVFRDRELAMVRLRAFGKFALRVIDGPKLVSTLVGSRGLFTTDALEGFVRDLIVSRLNDLLGETLTSIFDLPSRYEDLAAALRPRVAEALVPYGLDVPDLLIGAITPPPEVQ
ncbi:MAG: SPFH domain-containing protein, partial [Acidobacteriota bacterium]